jgi:hypothetical protein
VNVGVMAVVGVLDFRPRRDRAVRALELIR